MKSFLLTLLAFMLFSLLNSLFFFVSYKQKTFLEKIDKRIWEVQKNTKNTNSSIEFIDIWEIIINISFFIFFIVMSTIESYNQESNNVYWILSIIFSILFIIFFILIFVIYKIKLSKKTKSKEKTENPIQELINFWEQNKDLEKYKNLTFYRKNKSRKDFIIKRLNKQIELIKKEKMTDAELFNSLINIYFSCFVIYLFGNNTYIFKDKNYINRKEKDFYKITLWYTLNLYFSKNKN
ncbi:hypothetical protein ACXX84_03050 [Mycoplasma sp. AC157]